MADLIVLGEWVVTQNEQREIIKNGAVAVKGPVIEAIGPAETILAEHGDSTPRLQAKHGLVMPGLINAHSHVAMTLLRGLADDLPLMAWLNDHIFPAEAKLTGDMVFWGALLGCAEMIMSGTTCFCDMYLFEDQVARAVDRAGIRALVGEVLYDFPSPNYGAPDQGLKFTQGMIEEYRDHPLIDVAVEPHSAYTCSPELLKACQDLARRLDAPLITHLSENQDEVRTIRERYGTTPVRHLEALGLLAPNFIADHCTILDQEEIAILARTSTRVVTNPESNLKLASGVCPVPDLLRAGIPVALGTDGPASNNNLDMFGEMNTLAKLHKVISMDSTVMKAGTALDLATRGGSEVLGYGARLGRLEPGAMADLIVLDMNQPHLTPVYHPVSHLVYAAGGGDVLHSVIHGRVVMQDRQLTTIDLAEVYGRISEISKTMAVAVGRD